MLTARTSTILACSLWYAKPAFIASILVAPLLVWLLLGGIPELSILLVGFYILSTALLPAAGYSLLVSWSAGGLQSYLWPAWPLDSITPETVLGLTLLIGLVSSLKNALRYPYIDPALESISRWPSPRLSPLAALTLSWTTMYYSGVYSIFPTFIIATYGLSSTIIVSLVHLPLFARLFVALLSAIGPAGLLLASLLAAHHPYCYNCPTLHDNKSKVVAAIARTWPTRGVGTARNGMVVSCAKGFSSVYDDQYHDSLEVVLDSWHLATLLSRNEYRVQKGCRGEIIIVTRHPTDNDKNT